MITASTSPAYLRDNCESTYDYGFHLTCVMPIASKTFQTSYILVIKNSQRVKPQIQKISALTEHTDSKCPPRALRDGDATDWWLQQSNDPAFSIRLTVSVQFCKTSLKYDVSGSGNASEATALRRYTNQIIITIINGITQASLKMQPQLCSAYAQ